MKKLQTFYFWQKMKIARQQLKNQMIRILTNTFQKFDHIDKWVRSNKLVVGGGDRIELEVRWFTLLIEQIMDESIAVEL